MSFLRPTDTNEDYVKRTINSTGWGLIIGAIGFFALGIYTINQGESDQGWGWIGGGLLCTVIALAVFGPIGQRWRKRAREQDRGEPQPQRGVRD